MEGKEPGRLFSREALDRMRSPERLDTLLPVTTPTEWMLLAAVGAALFSVLLWSVFGAFTVRADGMGMLLDSAGVANVSHIAGGKISEIYVATGSVVHRGDRIAKMEQAEQSAQTRMARYGMGLATNDRDAMGRVYEYDARRQQQNVAEDILCDYDGIVDEIMVGRGSVVASGDPICMVRLTQARSDLTGVLYVPVDKGKRIAAGQTVQLAPNGVDTSQSGSLIGVVRSVGAYPISAQGLERRLGNAQLAGWILSSQNSALMEVKFDLVRDADSPSGYLWTSVIGEHPPVTAGSFCTGSVIIDRRPPIQKVFYQAGQWLRSR